MPVFSVHGMVHILFFCHRMPPFFSMLDAVTAIKCHLVYYSIKGQKAQALSLYIVHF